MKPVAPHPKFKAASRALLAVAVCATWLGTNDCLRAATSTNRLPAQGSEDRFLLIVDTSADMERNAANTSKAVSQLMSTGLAGQARAGDTVGLWTFNEALHTGVFPLQRWTPQTRQKIAAAAGEFMTKVRYEKQSRFEKVIGPLTSVVKDSERITVLILTDGSSKISGTPFDKQINESYRLNYAVQRKQRMPFITVLRAQSGEFTGWRVNTPPFRPEFPPFASDAKPGETKPDSKPPVTPSLIVVGEDPVPASPITTNAPAAPATAAPAATPATAAPAATQETKPEAQPSPPVTAAAIQTTATNEAPSTVKPAEAAKTAVETPAATTTSPPPAEPAGRPVSEPPPPKQEVRPPAEPKPTVPEATAAAPQEMPAAEPAAETPIVQAATATPAESWLTRTNLVIAGGVLVVVAFALFYLLMRRAARPAEKVSLITRSMDRDPE